MIDTRVDLDDWEARDDVLDSIAKPLYHGHEWRHRLPDDPFPDGLDGGVRMEQRSRAHGTDRGATTVLDFRSLVLAKPRGYLMFGPPNEVEYSANVIFQGDRLRLPPADPAKYIYEGWRDYYTTETLLFHDNLHISYNRPAFCERMLIRTVLRADRRPSDATTAEDFSLSAKLKIYRRSVYVAGRYKLTLSGSIEMPYDRRSTRLPARLDDGGGVWLPRGNKSLLMLYWGIEFTVEGKRILLRVAFRQPASMRVDNLGTVPRRIPGSDTKCNIECESYVSGDLYVRLLRILYLYYRHQFEQYDGLVLPYRADCTPDSLSGLDEEERAIARTYAHVPWHVCHAEETESVEPSAEMGAFVRFLGLTAYASYDAYGEIVCGDEAIVALMNRSYGNDEESELEGEEDDDGSCNDNDDDKDRGGDNNSEEYFTL